MGCNQSSIDALKAENDALKKTSWAQYPRTKDGLTREWLSQVLHSEVVSFEVTAPGNEGVMSDVLIVALQYAAGSRADLPASVVVKISKGTPETRQTAVDNGYYAKECQFFRSFAGKVPMTVPKCHGVFEDPSDVGTFCIVMEDMTTNWVPGRYTNNVQ
jgi:hypothetical protein